MSADTAMTEASREPIRNYVAGRWTAPSGTDFLPVTNPTTGESLGRVPLSTGADVDTAVAAATAAFPAWRRTPPVERARVFFRLKHLLEEHKEDLGPLAGH